MLFLDGAPNRLSVFLIDSESGAPLELRPLFAEVVVPYAPSLRPLPKRFEALYDPAVYRVDDQLTREERQRVISAVKRALTRVLTDESQDHFAYEDPEGLEELIEGSLKRIMASTEGSRALTAENVQRLSDSFAQASASQRDLNSTVVIQAHQAEKETIQTRTFTNYNHAHTLTVRSTTKCCGTSASRRNGFAADGPCSCPALTTHGATPRCVSTETYWNLLCSIR
jgi:hypothetical protein